MNRRPSRSTLSFAAVLTALTMPIVPACANSVETDPEASDQGEDEADVNQRATTPLKTLDLGTVGVNQPVKFQIPAGTLGFTVMVTGEQADDFVEVSELRNPRDIPTLAGAMVVGGSAPTAQGFQGIAAAPVPQSDGPESAPTAGTWQATFAAYDPTTGQVLTNRKLRARVSIQQTIDGKFHGGRLDLHVYIPEGLQIQDPTPRHGITAASAARDSCVKTRIDAFYKATKELVGIDRGVVKFHPVAASYVEVTSQEELGAFFSESRVVPDTRALHFMLTNRLETFPGAAAWGIAGGIGGAATRSGTALSGVALAVGPTFPAAGDALTMLHEAGHYIGLNHTSELDGLNADPISDTPQCAGINQTNFMQCPERRNLMFPMYYAGSDGGVGVTLSPGQVRTFRGSPLYRAYRK